MWSLFCFTIVLDFSAPPSHKINNNILIYLTSYGILAPPLPVIKIKLSIVASWERSKSYKKIMENPSLPLR